MKHLQLLFWVFTLTLLGCSAPEKYTVGNDYHGFKLVEKRFVKEVNAECLYFQHEKSGARLFKIMSNDPNKLFSIAFKTIPEDDYGTPHIIEHSVLNGSKNFPVKSPFDVLMKGSLNTFLNAMTSSDWTMYPVASLNDKDYFNLMHVYLDAVFNPNIYSDRRIFMQEGWHHEMQDVNGDITYKGVVYNEMKGAYSNPLRELYYYQAKLLFPDNGYGLESGGYPTAIPQLTYEKFLNFHRKYYHPSNSYIMLYGNADLDQELTLIDKEYLSGYTKSTEEITIPLQKPFAAMKTEVRYYPVTEGESTENKTYFNLSFVSGKNTDRAKTMLLKVLADALVNNEQGVVRRALTEAGIGSEVSASVDEYQQNVLSITVLNANATDQKKFNDIVFSTLQKVAKDGLDSTIVNGIVNRKEFDLREGDDAQKGLLYFMENIPNWFFEQNPFTGLEYEKYLADVKLAIKNGDLQKMITSELINNPHTLSLAMVPQTGLQKTLTNALNKELADYKQSLNQAGKDSLVKVTKDLIAYQQQEDADSLVAKIPMLSLKDISPESEFYGVEERKASDMPVIYSNQFTNGIVYTSLFFDTRTIAKEDIPYINLLTNLLGMVSTQNYTFGQLENELNTQTGGFNVQLRGYTKNWDDNQLRPYVRVNSKAISNKTSEMYRLIAEILTTSNLADTARLKELLTRHKAELDLTMQQDGVGVALKQLYSDFSNEGTFSEMKGGLTYYRFVNSLVSNFDGQKAAFATKLNEVAHKVFNTNNILIGITCSPDEYKTFESSVAILQEKLDKTPVTLTDWKFDFKKKNEGIETSSKVQYVLQGANFKQLGYDWNGHILVLKQLLRTDYLQTQLRVIGGAYGAFANFTPSGNTYFGSYRDPNLAETLKAFQGMPAYLDSLKLDETSLTRYIIGTIANIDDAKTASDKGEEAYWNYLTGNTKEQQLKERSEILSTTEADLKAFKPMIESILKQNSYAVFGNEQKIIENKNLFDELLKVSE